MGGKGSGNPGQSRGAGGEFVVAGLFTMATAEAVDNVDLLKQSSENLTKVLDKNTSAIDKNSRELEENTQEKGENNKKTRQGTEDIDAFAINMQIATSALNQSTGALLKMAGGFEKLGIGSEKTHESFKKVVAVLEIFTGVFEFVLTALLIQHLYNKMATASTLAYATSVKVAALAMWNYAAAQAAALAPFLPIILAIALFVTVIVLMIKYVDEIDALIGKFTDKMGFLSVLVGDVAGGVTGLTSSFTSLGDAITDNPVTKMVSKAGGAIF